MTNYDYATHELILEMTQLMTQCTALNPPVLETYSTSCSLIERRQFTDMIQLANHILFLAQMHTLPDLAGQIQRVLENWVCRGDPMPNQFIYKTAELFANIGYRFRVVQWTTREQAFDQLVSAAHNATLVDAEIASDIVFEGSRIEQDYTSFTPWAINSFEGQYHASNLPPQQSPRRVSIYKKDVKIDLDCIGCPTCSFCTKVKKDMLKHEAQHWDDDYPCVCAYLDEKVMAKEIDTKVCHCGRLAIDENARMLRDWADERTGHLVYKFGMSETMPTFANVTAIQMQRDVTFPKMEQYLNVNSEAWN
ncbi:hypothetical protein KCU81_g7171, partial [Aureobasidium melanogenum]|uniref:Uncharacterized protein n=1 Tax=Aureobasidium melanogenum (strain CBS 110374) TaxID=1043003 RepID=A0A074VLV2_AURM1